MKKKNFNIHDLLFKSLGAKFVVLVVIALFSTELAFAPPPRPDPNIPIDGGILWLIIAGIGYGGKKIFDSKKKGDS